VPADLAAPKPAPQPALRLGRRAARGACEVIHRRDDGCRVWRRYDVVARPRPGPPPALPGHLPHLMGNYIPN
jgi:hypothetical protein